MKNPLVSVVLPTYNRAPIIGASIESILKQSYDQLELIIINDCSSDGTYEKLQSYLESDDRIKIYHNQKRLGLPASRNKGVLLSEGSLIFFSEDDLVLDDNCILTLVKFLSSLDKANRPVGAVGPRLISFLGVVLTGRDMLFQSVQLQETLNVILN